MEIPGQIPGTGFASAGTTSNDTVSTVNIPVTMTLPPGFTTWNNQSFFYWIDAGSTAEHGVDYKATGGEIFSYAGKVPTPRNIPIKILPTGNPRSRTVVIEPGIAASTSTLGPFSTFTYTISNPDPLATFHAFMATAFPGVCDPAIIGENADPDGDGFNNLLEFALKGDPAFAQNRGHFTHAMQNLHPPLAMNSPSPSPSARELSSPRSQMAVKKT